MAHPRNDLYGKIFGSWLVLEEAEGRRKPCGELVRRVRVRCTCGKESTVFATAIVSGRSSSCSRECRKLRIRNHVYATMEKMKK